MACSIGQYSCNGKENNVKVFNLHMNNRKKWHSLYCFLSECPMAGLISTILQNHGLWSWWHIRCSTKMEYHELWRQFTTLVDSIQLIRKICLQEIRLQTQSIAANFSFLLCLGSQRLLLHKILNQSYTMTLNKLDWHELFTSLLA